MIRDAEWAFEALGPDTPRMAARRILAQAFAAGGIESAELDARVLLCAALRIDHAGLIRDPDLLLGQSAETLEGFARRRLAREPVSRIIGAKEFWGSRFGVSPDVLDPRPDTEILVEAVLAHTASDMARPWRILDLGVGSGAILCALLASLPSATGVGIDLSARACATAARNLAALGLSSRGKIICGNWSAPLKGRFDLIVSNPPYIASAEIPGLEPEVRNHDPLLALDGGADGLEAYRELIPALPSLLAPGGVVALEFGIGQRRAVSALLEEARLMSVNVTLDLGGRERIISAQTRG